LTQPHYIEIQPYLLQQHYENLVKEGLKYENVGILQEDDLIKLGELKFVARQKLIKLKGIISPPQVEGNVDVTSLPKSGFLSGKCAIVTGSTSGIGYAIAKSLASKGCNIVITGSRPIEKAQQTVNDLQKEYNVKVIYCQADLSKPQEAAEVLIKATVNQFGTVHILVNNAGVQHVSPVDTFPPSEWDRLIATNLTSAFHLIQLSLPLMKKNVNKWGRIVNISSVHGLVASINKAAYIASKHGLNGLTKVVALETAADTQITANAICPGWVNTDLVRKQIQTRAEQKKISFEEATESLLEKQPTRRFTNCDAIGDMVVFLCSEAGSNITGSEQVMDGGWSTQ